MSVSVQPDIVYLKADVSDRTVIGNNNKRIHIFLNNSVKYDVAILYKKEYNLNRNNCINICTIIQNSGRIKFKSFIRKIPEE